MEEMLNFINQGKFFCLGNVKSHSIEGELALIYPKALFLLGYLNYVYERE